MNAHERRLGANLSVHQRNGAFVRAFSLDPENLEGPETRGQLGAGHDPDATLRAISPRRGAMLFFSEHEGPVLYQATGGSGALHRAAHWLT